MATTSLFLDSLILGADAALLGSFAAVYYQVKKTRSAAGLSFQTLGCVAAARCLHLLSHPLGLHFRPTVLPFWLYGLMDILNAAFGTYVLVHTTTRYKPSYEAKKDNFGQAFFERMGLPVTTPVTKFGFIYLFTAVLAFLWYLVRRSHSSFYVSYFCCFYEWPLFPQLWMFQQDKVVSAPLANFVVLTAASRACTLVFWFSYPLVFKYAYPDNRGVQMASETLNLLILSDFLYYYFRSRLRGEPQVILPIPPVKRCPESPSATSTMASVPPSATAVPEIRWIVDTDAASGGMDVDVAKFPPNFDGSNVAEGGVSGFSNISSDASLTSQRTKVRVELEIGEKKNFNAFKKKEEQIRTARYDEEDSMTLRGASQGSNAIYCGRPTANDTSCWFSLSVDPTNPGVYKVAPVRKWLEFRPLSGVELRMARNETPATTATATDSTSASTDGAAVKSSKVKEETETEIAEQVMKKQRLADKNDEKRFIRMRAAIELKKAKAKGGETEEGHDAEKAARKEAKRKLRASKTTRHDLEAKEVPSSSLSVGKLYAVKHDDEWEGNEDFSDDDELLDDPDAGNEVQIETTGTVDKEKEKLKEARTGRDSDDESSSSSESEDEQSTLLGKAITSIMEKERNKEEVRKEGLADAALDDELLQTGVDPDELDDDAGQTDEKARKDGAGGAAAAPIKAKPSKQDEMKDKLKQLFARNEYRLGLREVLATFPGMKKNSEEYKCLTRSLKDMAEVRDHLLYLKKEYRK
ncbi:hypothetical protein FOZ60_002120 [Perkinsus olseni]|uniref:Uncharacterized protein n=1 Tax=Perkinsus olseni TaxID=32597 RepID=A0A7J6NYS1_PEROL|nr:hypothetical protein FOZ60_002120 [Perkinsus olseni]